MNKDSVAEIFYKALFSLSLELTHYFVISRKINSDKTSVEKLQIIVGWIYGYQPPLFCSGSFYSLNQLDNNHNPNVFWLD